MLRRWVTPGVFVTLAVIGVACESSPTATLNPGPLGDSQEADALRQLAFAYWEAFNAYDADRALGYLEEDYRQQRDGTVLEIWPESGGSRVSVYTWSQQA